VIYKQLILSDFYKRIYQLSATIDTMIFNQKEKKPMKRFSILFMIAFLLIPVTMVNAQEALEVGTVLTGDITNAEFEVEYTFTGTAGNVVIINMPTKDEDGYSNDLSGQIILLDSSNAVIADTANDYNFDVALVTQLPADDDYIVIITREDGRSGDTEGNYAVELIVPDVIGMGDSATGAVSSEGNAAYYVINSEEDFVLLYGKSAGDFDPEISISTLNENNSDLEDYAAANGQLSRVAMGDMEAGIYIVKVAEGFFSYYFDEVTADFEISVVSVD
jgi:hypothetical protein